MIKKLEFLLPKKGAVILGCILIFFLGLIFFLTKGNPVFPPLQTFAKVEKEVSKMHALPMSTFVKFSPYDDTPEHRKFSI